MGQSQLSAKKNNTIDQSRTHTDKSTEFGTNTHWHTNTLSQSELRQSAVICLPGLWTICGGILATKNIFITNVSRFGKHVPPCSAVPHRSTLCVTFDTCESRREENE